ncbi:MAG: acetate--CoA ligase family protein [Aquisalimonadaceae bacterium]
MTTTLRALLRPESVAIIGASSDFQKVSGRPLMHLLEKGYAGGLYPVNPRAREIGGQRCYARIKDLPEGIDLAIIVLPAEAVADAVRALGRRSVPAAVVFASGFSEVGDAGRALEAELARAVKESGVRVCGPNCLGLFNAFEHVIATFSQYVDGEVPAGPVGFVSQSGAFGTAISALARNRGLGLGYFVNTGNEVDITFVDAMEAVLADARIRVGAGYIEGLKNGPGLCRIGDMSMEKGIPLVLTKVGRMNAGARAAASHTGSLAGEDVVFDGVVRQKGIIRARNEEHMLDMVEVFASCGLPEGSGIGIATQSGGAGVLIADRAEEVGLEVPELSPATRKAIQACIPGFGATANPVDVTGQFVREPAVLRDSVIHMLNDPAVHVGIIWLQLMDAYVDTLTRIFEDIKARASKPFVVAWVAAPQAALEALRARGIAVVRGAEPAADAVLGLVQYAAARRRWLADRKQREALPRQTADLPAAGGVVSTTRAVALLEEAGVTMAPVRQALNAEEAVAAAGELGYPVVMKIESPDILHKTEVNGVRLSLNGPEAVRDAYADILAEARKRRPQARLEGVILQPMSSGDVEFVIGLQRDPVFGNVIMAGLGGILIEVLKDVAFRKCPLTPSEAEEMLASLRGAEILNGVRGRPGVNREALINMLCGVSRFGAASEGRLRELDLNPVLLSRDGAVAVDVVMMLDEATQ